MINPCMTHSAVSSLSRRHLVMDGIVQQHSLCIPAIVTYEATRCRPTADRSQPASSALAFASLSYSSISRCELLLFAAHTRPQA